MRKAEKEIQGEQKGERKTKYRILTQLSLEFLEISLNSCAISCLFLFPWS